MFTKKQIEDALRWLFSLMDPSQLNELHMLYADEIRRMSLDDLVLAFNKHALMMYEFTLPSKNQIHNCQHGEEIFPVKAVNLVVEYDAFFITNMLNITHHNELWLTEDMKFMIVRSTGVMVTKCNTVRFVIEQRTVLKEVQDRGDMFCFDIKTLFGYLYSLCYQEYPYKGELDEKCD